MWKTKKLTSWFQILYENAKGPKFPNSLKKEREQKMEYLYYLISRLIIKPQSSKQCGINTKLDI